MLIIESPETRKAERDYIYRVVFGEFFGLNFEIHYSDRRGIRLSTSPDESGSEITLTDVFLNKPNENWFNSEHLPDLPLSTWVKPHLPYTSSLKLSDVPVLFGEKLQAGEYCSVKPNKISFGLDILGSLFFLLSRFEEQVVPDRDHHGRFPASSSVLGRSNLLHRAIGNEYIEILWAAMQWLWPGLKRRKRSFRILPSHDIDHPSFYWRFGAIRRARQALGIFHRDRPSLVFHRALEALLYPHAGWAHDPYDTIDSIMDLSEAANAKSAFYYIPEVTDPRLDPEMPITHPQVVAQWQRIHARGHEIGLHPGYQSFDQPNKISSGANAIRRQLEKLGIDQPKLGGRQHYLRWATPVTALALEAAQVDYDSTLGFAEQAGFRCGVCYEYPMFDMIGRKQLKLRQRPLIAMECSVMDKRYMNLGCDAEAFDCFKSLKETCQRFNGDFTILWHNSRLIKRPEASLYRSILEFAYPVSQRFKE